MASRSVKRRVRRSRWIERVDCSGDCWEWTGSKDRLGYGTLTTYGKTLKAHRQFYELYNGLVPEGLFVCHHCDNPGCVNPEHLFLGSHADNMLDMTLKGRHARRRLTEPDVAKIRASSESHGKAAKRFDVALATIKDIRSRRTWKHVE